MEAQIYECLACRKRIDGDEYVVNWGSCNPCVEEHYAKYLRNERIKYVARKAAVWVLATVIAAGLSLYGEKVIGTVLYYLSQ